MRNLWQEYVGAILEHQARPTTESTVTVINAYATWCRDFCPSQADRLTFEFAERVTGRTAHAA